MQGDCKKIAPLEAEKAPDMELAPGQLVETGAGKKALFTQALGALLPPLAGFAGGYLAAARCFPSRGEGFRAAGGVFLLFAGAAVFYAFRRRFPSRNLPRILRVLQPPKGGPDPDCRQGL
jgi:positive regulator of sigma E activity